MVVTKAPSEPWAVAERTLRAMLAQQFPAAYDVWLADEDPNAATLAWCAAHNVHVSCRKGVIGYNNAHWPGREKCKEGNLRYFYEVAGGYDNYDFVVQMDVDHAPSPTYLVEMIRPFADCRVGYVAAPSICDRNAPASWSARGRLYAEAPWHGPVQAGYNDGFAPQCIGSHYAVRTQALREIGGLGPELAEDFSTTLMMNAHGWRGAFAFRALASGDGPACLADCITQEYQWARSIMRIMLLHNWPLWRRLPPPLKAKFGFCQVWYPLYTLHALMVSLLPLLALITRTPWVRVNLLHFILLSAMPSLFGLAAVAYTARLGHLRPWNSGVISPEATLFQFVRWPWMLAGLVDAVVGVVLRRESSFKVTPKGSAVANRLPWWLLAPYVFLVGLQVGVLVWVREPDEAVGYYVLALANAAIYTAVVTVVAILHFLESGSEVRPRLVNFLVATRRAMPAAASVVVLFATALYLRGPEAASIFSSPPIELASGDARAREVLLDLASTEPQSNAVVEAPAEALPTPVVPPTSESTVGDNPAPSVSTGGAPQPDGTGTTRQGSVLLPTLPNDRLAIGAYDPWELLADAQLDLELWYVLQDEPLLLQGALVHARDRRTPLITIEPFRAGGRPDDILETVASGAADAELRDLARVVRANRPRVVLIRWAHEMELTGLYPWSVGQPELYRRAYRRVVETFWAEGADNARWVWSPAGNEGAAAFYPGDDVVDYVGMTILGDADWDAAFGQPPQSFAQLVEVRYARLGGLGKPLIVAELGVSGSPERQNAWLEAAAAALEQLPSIVAVVYFNDRNPPTPRVLGQPDWRITPDQLDTFTDLTVRLQRSRW